MSYAKARATVQAAIDSGILNNTNRAHELVDLIAKISEDKGITFDFTNNERLKASGFALEGVTVNGYVQNGKVTINTQSAKYLNSVVGHEIMHVLEGSEFASELTAAAIEYAKAKGEYQARYNAIVKAYAKVEGFDVNNADSVNAELVADIVGDYLFTDSKFIQNLSAEKPKLFKWLWNEVKYFVKSVTPGTKEAKSLNKLEKVFEKAYQDTKKAPESGEVRYSMAGEKAATADKLKLETAEKMLAEGVDSETVRRETGWFKGYDGKWRFEIVDPIEMINTDKLYESRFTTLGELIEHPDLFAAYPDLADIQVTFEDISEGNGHYNRDFDTISLSDNYTKPFGAGGLLQTLTHEIQHAVQTREEFARGASPSKWAEKVNGGKLVEQASKKTRDIFEKAPDEFKQMVRKLNRAVLDYDDALVSQMSKEIADSQYADLYIEYEAARQAERNIREIVQRGDLSPIELYYRTAGEVEARDSANRLGLTTEERKQKRPDIDRSDVVFEEDSGASWMAAKDAKYDPETASIAEQIRHHQDELNKMDVVGSAKVPKSFKSKETARIWATDALKSTGYQVDKQGFGVVYFNPKDINNGLNYADTDAEKAAFAVLDKVIKRGIVIESHSDHKGRSNTDPRGRSKQTVTIAAPVELNGTRGNMAIVVNRNGNHYYAHRILLPDGSVFVFSDIKEEARQEPYRGVTENSSLADTTSLASKDSIAQNSDNVNRKNSLSDDGLGELPIRGDLRISGKDVTLEDLPIREDISGNTYNADVTDIFEKKNPFNQRDIKTVGKDRKLNAFMFDNPDLKHFFQDEAFYMLNELDSGTKGARVFDKELANKSTLKQFERHHGLKSIKRNMPPEIEYLRDECNYSYDQIRKGLNDIIEDSGAENNAVSKKLEILINKRLTEGYTSFTTGEIIEPNKNYIDAINKLTTENVNSDTSNSMDPFFDAAVIRALENDGVDLGDVPIREDIINASGFGVTQDDINDYVDRAGSKTNSTDHLKYAEPSERLIQDVQDEIDISGYIHTLRDNDIRHIYNSHGEKTNEKYPITPADIKAIPNIVYNYDKVFVVKRAGKDAGSPERTGIIYVKVNKDNTVYYLEQATDQYHNENLLVNKQMIKVGLDDIPKLKGLEDAITKKQSKNEYLADLNKARKVYVQDATQSYSNGIIPNAEQNVKGNDKNIEKSEQNSENKEARTYADVKREKKKNRSMSHLRRLIFDKGSAVEDLSLKTGNRELQGKWQRMLTSQARAQKYIGDGEGDVKSIKDLREILKAHNIQGSERLSINQFTSEDIKKAEPWAQKFYAELGTKSPFFRAWFGDWRAYDTKEIKYVPVNTDFVSKGEIPYGDYYNQDTEWNVLVRSNGVEKTKSQMGVGSNEHRALTDLKKIIDSAVLLDTVVADKPSKKMGATAAFVHHLYCPITMNGKKAIAKLYISEHIGGEHKFYLTKIEEVTHAIGKSTNEGAAVHRAEGTAGDTSPTISIAEIFDFVKKNDKLFESDSKNPVYFVPKAVNPLLLYEDRTPKVFYHGTNEQFTVFDPAEMSHREGSYFFAENKEDAAAYGDNIFEVYLSAENLANYDDQPLEFYKLKDKRAKVEWLKERGYDGWYADMDSGGWGEVSVFDNTQIKSATNNIGTFDGKDPDMRYSDRDENPYSYESLVSKKDMQVTTLPKSIPSNRADIVAEAKKNAAKIGKFNTKDGSASVHVKDIDTDVILATNGLKHGLDRRLGEMASITIVFNKHNMHLIFT